MIPNFSGRIQTRIFALLVAGVPATLLITLVIPATLAPGKSRGSALGGLYAITFTALAIVIVMGVVVWEPIYHGLQQFRWEKDWPTMFGFLTGINEGVVAYFILKAIGPTPTGVGVGAGGFAVDFVFVWLVTFLFVNGPMRVPFIRWRFRGGRIIGS
jgi:hypothetical protein